MVNYCLTCGLKLSNGIKKSKIPVEELSRQEEKFIRESNAIEREYSESAFEDACEAYKWAKENMNSIIDVKYILKIHEILMKRLNKRIAGKIRDVDVYVGDKKMMSPEDLRFALRDWCISCYHNAEDVKQLHIWFEEIHPFQDGNGRTGRILMNIQRLKIGLPILVIHEGEDQQKYYQWFKENKNG